MSLPVIIEDEARLNIVQSANWWMTHRSEEQARRWYDGILAAIETLADNPIRSVLARENPRSHDELHELHFGLGSRPTHRIIFVIDPDAVRVLSVRHAAQDDWGPPSIKQPIHILGIIGGVASGKSLVAQRFQELGAEVLNADQVGHEVLREEGVKQAIRQRFGDGVFDDAGEIVRKKVAQVVFAEDSAGAKALADLEAIVHPRIGERLRERIAEIACEGKTQVVVLDAAVMLQAGWGDACDQIIFIDVPREIRIERAKSRGWTAEELDARDARQTPLAEKRAAADVVIDNSGSASETRKQIDRLWAAIAEKWRRPP